MEQYYFNNISINPFTVESDKTNPLLDVTFDGIHIMNQDIINSEPEILITLKDENTILMLNEDSDTNNIQVYLMDPNQNTWTRIPYQQQQQIILNYELADDQNPFKIVYNPIFSTDGIYKLKVQGRDKSGNKNYLSGKEKINQIGELDIVNVETNETFKIKQIFNK